MTPTCPNFLVVDDNSDSRFLLARTLLRRFPSAVVEECQSAEAAIRAARGAPQTAVIVHRAVEMSGLDLLPQLRAVVGTAPIVMVSSVDRGADAFAAGANAFLLYDEWLRIGTLVAELLGAPSERGGVSAPPFGTEPRPTTR